ncbi:peptidylprolyl isomerase fpr3 [Elasticomyces elasticus]|nr:peptidylprolyl isomerase fpr3 [Elasticomyces elasticus]
MSGMLPMAMFGQEVVPDGSAVIAGGDVPAAFRITMAAIDPTAIAQGEDGAIPRATLKIIRQPLDPEDMYDDEDSDDEEDFDADEMDAMLGGGGSDSDEDDEEEVNGGPSDPSKSKNAKIAALMKKLKESDSMDVDEPQTNGVNGVSKKAKGKRPASDEDEDSEEDSDEDDEDLVEEFVICTLDPEKNYQQPLDLTIGEKEMVFFKVIGTHSIFLTGNYVEPEHQHNEMYDPDDESDEDYDLEPSEDELDDDEMDELDDMEDPRITEVGEHDEEAAPKLIEAPKKAAAAADKKSDKKTSKKRAAEDEPQTLEELIEKATPATAGDAAAEPKLSKKQLKKLKKNDGTATAAPTKAEDAKVEAPNSAKSDKKVSFAKELEQGPTPTKGAAEKAASADDKGKAGLGVKTVQGVTIDDKKLGSGPAAKKGDRIGMRYIGKLAKDGKVFDSNKKGKPFSFKLGAGEVIKGWEIGIAGMSVGGERRVTIPAQHAYGAKGAGKDIPPNSTLIFDVKLIELNKGK